MFTEITIHAFESPELTSLDFFSGGGGGWMKSKVYKTKVDTRDKFLARILDAFARIKTRDQLKQHAIFAHELQSSLRLTVGLSKIYYEM
jgi:hypothetical protein